MFKFNPFTGNLDFFEGPEELDLNDLGDVSITNPQADDGLFYNGSEWINKQGVAISEGPGIVLFPDVSSSGIGSYDNIYYYPSGGSEAIETAVVNNGTGEVLIDGYITPELGRTTLDAGAWEFNTYRKVSLTAVGDTHLVIRVFKRTSGGVETELFNVAGTKINDTEAALGTIISVQSSFSVNLTDRLLVKYYAVTSSPTNITVSFYHNGSTHYSHIHTPLHTLHADLAGLQGGSAGEYYHLTQAQQQDVAGITDTPTASKVPKADTDGKLDGWITDASDSAKGKVELATDAETTTGTDAGRAVTPDGLAGSGYGKRIMLIPVIDNATALAVGDGKFIFPIPIEINGWNLVGAQAYIDTVSSSGTPTIQIRNVTDSQDMLSTRITIDANENSSYTAVTPPVIDTNYDDVATGDRIAIDVDVAGTGAKGLQVILTFQLP